MLIRVAKFIVLLFVLNVGAGAGVAFADWWVVPVDSVEKTVRIRSLPNSRGKDIAYLAPGERVQLSGALADWRQVKLSDGRVGYISKKWTRLIGGTSSDVTLELANIGNGRALLIRAGDVSVLYDAGVHGKPNNKEALSDYLTKHHDDLEIINHLVLSGEEDDRINLVSGLIRHYTVDHVWLKDAGLNSCLKGKVMGALATAGAVFHARNESYSVKQMVYPSKCGSEKDNNSFYARFGGRLGSEWINLGKNLSVRFFYLKGDEGALVAQFSANGANILLSGDADAGYSSGPGERFLPDSEEYLLIECCEKELESAVLLLGDNGSAKASRSYYLDIVKASLFFYTPGESGWQMDALVRDDLNKRGKIFSAQHGRIVIGVGAGGEITVLEGAGG